MLKFRYKLTSHWRDDTTAEQAAEIVFSTTKIGRESCRERVALLVRGLDVSVQQGVSGEAAADKLQGEGRLERGVRDGRRDELIADRCARR